MACRQFLADIHGGWRDECFQDLGKASSPSLHSLVTSESDSGMRKQGIIGFGSVGRWDRFTAVTGHGVICDCSLS
jgi:hypothetical protein